MKTRYIPTNPTPPVEVADDTQSARATFDLLNSLAAQFSPSNNGVAAVTEPVPAAEKPPVAEEPAVPVVEATPAPVAPEEPVLEMPQSDAPNPLPEPVAAEPAFFGAPLPPADGELSATEELELLRRGILPSAPTAAAPEPVSVGVAPSPELATQEVAPSVEEQAIPLATPSPADVAPEPVEVVAERPQPAVEPDLQPLPEQVAIEAPTPQLAVEPATETQGLVESPAPMEAEAPLAMDARQEEYVSEAVEQATTEAPLFFQEDPGSPLLTTGVVYDTAVDWMQRNGLPYDKTVVFRGYPKINSSWPCRLSQALVHGAYCVSKGQAFQIYIAETRDPLLAGANEAGELYGVAQVCEQLTGVYEALRYVFISYEASFPTKKTLGPDAPDGSPAEVLMVQLGDLLEKAHQQTRLSEGSLSLMDLIGASVSVALNRMFGGLVPLAELGKLLQDKERMDWIESHASELLGLTVKKSRYDE